MSFIAAIIGILIYVPKLLEYIMEGLRW
jgi:hypothetical protein